MKRLRILFNTYPVAFVTPGGGEVQLRKTFEALKELGICVELFNQWEPALENYDVVHFFSVFGGSSSFCDYVKRKGIKLVISPVLWVDDKNNYPIDEIQSILNLADAIMPNSRLEAEMLSETFHIPPSKFHVVYNGIDATDYDVINDNLFKDKYGLKEYILHVGNIEPRKNQATLIRAVQNLDIPLVIIGHIRDKNYFEYCKQQDKKQKVLFVPPMSHGSEELISAYAGADLFILPSTLETPGLAAMEAVAAGCPKLVVTAIGSTKEYFGSMAHYLETIDSPKYMEKIISEALSDDTIISQIQKCKFREQFNWKNTALQSLKVYNKVIDSVSEDIDLSEKIELLDGWYSVEYDGVRNYRWIEEKAFIKYQKCGKELRLTCCVLEKGFLLQCVFYNAVYEVRLKKGWNAYNILILDEQIHREGLMELKLNKIHKIPKDKRNLGMMVSQLKFSV